MFTKYLPNEINDLILMKCDPEDILAWNQHAKISQFVWLRKKERTFKEACVNNNLTAIDYILKAKISTVEHVIDSMNYLVLYDKIDLFIYVSNRVHIYDQINFLLTACTYDSIEIFKHLYDNSKNFNTILHFLGLNNSVKIANFILPFVDNDTCILYGLFRAIDRKNYEVFEKFFNHCTTTTPMILYYLLARKNVPTKFFNLVISKTINYDVDRALSRSVISGNIRYVKYFVARGATNIENCIDSSIRFGNQDVTLWLQTKVM